MSLLTYAGLAVASTAVIWTASSYLESAAEHLSSYYGLPLIVQGAIVAAVGSSFPELSSTVLSTLLHGEFDLGVGAIVGSAIFNILVIPGIAGLVGDTVQSSRDLVYKEAQFYMLSVAVLLITFSFAVIYYPVPDGALTGTVTRPLALIPVAVYGLYLFIQYQDTKDHDAAPAEEMNIVKQWAALIASLILIVIGVEGLVRAALGFGELFGTPSFLWGVTVIAAGTSLPDAFVSIRAAKGDKGVTSLANVLGSNVFDLLIAIPAGVLIAGAATINFAAAVPMMAALVLATIVLFAVLRTDLTLSRTESYLLILLYAVFLAWMLLETFNVTGLVPGA